MKVALEGKVAIVTASTRGIGFAIAQGLYNSGAAVCICGRDSTSLDASVQSLAASDSSRVLGLAGDIADSKFLVDLTEAVRTRFGHGADILVNNSGGPPAGEALSITEDQWSNAIDSNLRSVIRLCNLVVTGMKERGWGRIINLTSTAAREPAAGMVLSNVTRAGVAAYSKTLSQEVGPFGITVNTILTGGCLTDRLHSLIERNLKDTGESLEDALARIEKTIPVRHISTPEEFAQTALFLASPEASFITGAAIPVDGGASKSIF